MLRLPRGAMLLACVGVLAVAGVFAACGLDESGIVGGDASTTNDVNLDTINLPDIQVDNFIPVPDASPDASCLDASVPDGWILVGMKMEAGVTCPGQPGDFQLAQYVTNPTLDSNSCQCGGCGTSGTWTCEGTLYSGPTCNLTYTANGPGCTTINGGFHYGATVQRGGTVACGGGQQTGTGDASATPVGACIPQTSQADFCGLGQQGFGLCIINSSVTDGGCPSGFSNATIAGVQAVAACTTCSCDFTNADAGCTGGTVTAYPTASCDGGKVDTQAADGGCVNTTGFSSLLFAPDPPPTPNCQPSAAGGEALLAGPLTICCP